MVFSSMLFIFLFLSLNLVSQLFLPTVKLKNIAMLAFCLVFYGWAGPKYLLLLLIMVLVCWLGALLIQSTEIQKLRKRWLIITVAACLVLLGVFKYTGFFLGSFQRIFRVPKVIPEIALPIGISFYTLQLISYVADVYRNRVQAQKKYWILLLYASLFHLSIAGPIVRYRDVDRDLLRRSIELKDISAGISRFTIGLAKMAILSGGCAVIADQLLAGSAEELAAIPAAGILLGAFAFTLKVYLNFSACSDMAIGMGLMVGLHYKENFNYPYLSGSIQEFWQRWNISLSSFFRDYLYTPLENRQQELLGLFAAFALLGLWHGASWNFVLWGLFFGILIGIERFVLGDGLRNIPAALRHIAVLALVMFGWTIYKFTDLSLLGTAIRGLFGLNSGFTSDSVSLLFRNNVFFLIFATLAVTPIGKYLRLMLNNLSLRGKAAYWINAVWEVLHPVLLLILSAMALAGNSLFLYLQI